MALSITSITPNSGPISGNTPITIAGTDFHSNRVVTLLHCNGTDNSTTFTDDSGFGNTVSANGNARIRTAASVFGGASAYFDGNGDYLQIPDSTNFQLANLDFTIEAWINPTSNAGMGAAGVVCKRTSGGSNHAFSLFLGPTDGTVHFEWNNIAGSLVTEAAAVTYGQWQHIAVTRNGAALKIYVNGNKQAEGTIAVAISNYNQVVQIGRASSSLTNGFYTGYIDEIRITKGLAIYTGESFPVPTAELKNQAARVTIDGNPCVTTIVQSSTEITTITPAGTAGAKDVVLSV